MKIQNLLRPVSLFLLLLISLTGMSDHSLAQTQIQLKYGLDPATPLFSRVRETPVGVIKMFEEAGMSPRQHQLSPAERLIVERAFAALPPLHQRVLKEHLRSISFLDNMPNTALTSIVNTADAFRLYDITFRAAILRQNVSEWLTEKERACFDAKGSTYVVDGSVAIIADSLISQKAMDTTEGTFTTGVWSATTVFVPSYRNSLLDSTRYRSRGKILPVDSAGSVYRALERTPFVSIYSTSSAHEDLAECLAVYDLTRKLKQPFQIIIRDKAQQVFIYQPMRSKLVKSRMKYMQVFYATSAKSS